MKSVAQILKTKPEQAVYSVTPSTSVYDAVKLLADKNIGALLVMEGENIAGIFTERDYARKVTLMGLSSKETPVGDLVKDTISEQKFIIEQLENYISG